MRRRDFLGALGAAAAAWPIAARAQPSGSKVLRLEPPRHAANEAKEGPYRAHFQQALLQKAQALGAPMAALQRAIEISRKPDFSKKDALAVFDISQPSASRRFYVLDFKSGQASAHHAAHGKANGPNARAVKFKGFQRDLDMVPLGPLKTAHSEIMDHYKTIVDRYDGTVYRNMIVVVLEGAA